MVDGWPHVAEIDYDAELSRLYVTFGTITIGKVEAGGGAFLYQGVPSDVAAAFARAADKDTFFHDNILGKY